MSLLTKFILTRDINGYNGFGLPFSNNQFQALLLAGVGDSLTVPPSPYADYPNLIAVFSFNPGATVWVALNGTAVVPSTTFAACECELNPSARFVQSGDVLTFETSDVADQIGVSFYAVA
jgi:hypothetical protein